MTNNQLMTCLILDKYKTALQVYWSAVFVFAIKATLQTIFVYPETTNIVYFYPT